MKNQSTLKDGIPISVSLAPALEAEDIRRPGETRDKKRILLISFLSIIIAMAMAFVAKLLVGLIDLITNISFYGNFSFSHSSPADNHLGFFVILIPAAGGIIVGLMALYGSKAIRGHGIPEAMEQILTNKSKIKPAITYLKPLSSAISIGTGGPFGAEGPIIATGGALGSTLGQLTKITHNERKILLAAGATAGMSAIFGSPVAAIFLAIELLLFEFSPRSIIPVALACITGAAGHHLLFDAGPVFATAAAIGVPSSTAILSYALVGVLIGLLSIVITKSVYWIEDNFEHIPVHWMWYPAIGGIAVGVVGYFAPRTLGVGYNNITDILSGSLPVQLVISLFIMKFISWGIALGSGTSGGTLAPLLTIGGASGALLGTLAVTYFPELGLSVPLAALVGMSAMFAGASRALLTSIIFALETTMQSNALLPLLAGCTTAYVISFLLMENTIMTEKIARRGVKTPDSYEPDLLEKITVASVLKEDGIVIGETNTISEVREWLRDGKDYTSNYFIVSDDTGIYKGTISAAVIHGHSRPEDLVSSLAMRPNISVSVDSSLRTAVELMARAGVDVLPVISGEQQKTAIMGILSYHEIIGAYRHGLEDHQKNKPNISLKRGSLKILLKGKQLLHLKGRR